MIKTRTISKVNWSWDYGKVVSAITYSDGVEHTRINDEKPPTDPAHDIAHFICGFHEDCDWDYLWDLPRIKVMTAEYNAVFMESLLYFYTLNKYKKVKSSLLEIAKIIEDHMVWFVEDHYKFDISELELRESFLSKLDQYIICQHYQSYHDVCLMQLKTPDSKDVRDIKVELTMDSNVDSTNTEVYDYITEMMDILGV
tara:strand:- start:17495 stop:18088 length:594 start_codon:yes stop_codon:yes gene_type:complete